LDSKPGPPEELFSSYRKGKGTGYSVAEGNASLANTIFNTDIWKKIQSYK